MFQRTHALMKMNIVLSYFIIQALLVIFAIVLIHAAPAQDETIVDDVAQNEDTFVASPAAGQIKFLSPMLLKRLLMMG